MSMHGHSRYEHEGVGSLLTPRAGLVLIGFLIIGGALLFTEHRGHVLRALIWIPLLACPLMHLFMHGNHGEQGSGSGTNQGEKSS
jgi:hypothetical protein